MLPQLAEQRRLGRGLRGRLGAAPLARVVTAVERARPAERPPAAAAAAAAPAAALAAALAGRGLWADEVDPLEGGAAPLERLLAALGLGGLDRLAQRALQVGRRQLLARHVAPLLRDARGRRLGLGGEVRLALGLQRLLARHLLGGAQRVRRELLGVREPRGLHLLVPLGDGGLVEAQRAAEDLEPLLGPRERHLCMRSARAAHVPST